MTTPRADAVGVRRSSLRDQMTPGQIAVLDAAPPLTQQQQAELRRILLPPRPVKKPA